MSVNIIATTATKENFLPLASSLGDTLNIFGNSFEQYLETMIRNTSRSPVSEDPV